MMPDAAAALSDMRRNARLRGAGEEEIAGGMQV
jgi:hypothetical protein